MWPPADGRQEPPAPPPSPPPVPSSSAVAAAPVHSATTSSSAASAARAPPRWRLEPDLKDSTRGLQLTGQVRAVAIIRGGGVVVGLRAVRPTCLQPQAYGGDLLSRNLEGSHPPIPWWAMRKLRESAMTSPSKPASIMYNVQCIVYKKVVVKPSPSAPVPREEGKMESDAPVPSPRWRSR